MSAVSDPQDEGGSDRLFYGIDGTMGDAQDVPHPFTISVHGSWCSVCGLARAARCHTRDGRRARTARLEDVPREPAGQPTEDR